MFTLRTTSGEPVLMKDGTPFRYSTRELAKIGQRALEADRKAKLKIVADK